MSRRSVLVSLALLIIALAALAAEQFSVQVRSTGLRQRPSYLGPVTTELSYGTRVEVLESRGPWRQVRTFNELHVPGVELLHLSLACNHCAEPGCAAACPTLAYRRDAETGAVLLDQDRCIGCRYCTWACPYGAPRVDEALGVVAITGGEWLEHQGSVGRGLRGTEVRILDDDGVVTAGGRVLCVCALGRNVTEAQAEAYSACRRIHWNGAFTRSDIGQKAVDREREST